MTVGHVRSVLAQLSGGNRAFISRFGESLVAVGAVSVQGRDAASEVGRVVLKPVEPRGEGMLDGDITAALADVDDSVWLCLAGNVRPDYFPIAVRRISFIPPWDKMRVVFCDSDRWVSEPPEAEMTGKPA